MKNFLSLTALLFSFLTLTSALPSKKPHHSKPPPQPKGPPKTTYLLKTEAVDGKLYDGLLVETYHTEAAGNALVLVEDKAHRGLPVFLDEDYLFFTFGKGKYEQYPVQLALTDPSASWGTTSANIFDKATKGFAMTKDGYLVIPGYNKAVQYADKGAHWRVCEWTHGVPELFWNFPETWDNVHPKSNPSTCSLVNLKMIKKT